MIVDNDLPMVGDSLSIIIWPGENLPKDFPPMSIITDNGVADVDDM